MGSSDRNPKDLSGRELGDPAFGINFYGSGNSKAIPNYFNNVWNKDKVKGQITLSSGTDSDIARQLKAAGWANNQIQTMIDQYVAWGKQQKISNKEHSDYKKLFLENPGREQSIKVGHETLATPGPNYDAPRIGGFKRKTLV